MASYITPMVLGYILVAVLLIVAGVAAFIAIEIRSRPKPPPEIPAPDAWAPSSAFELPPKPDRPERP